MLWTTARRWSTASKPRGFFRRLAEHMPAEHSSTIRTQDVAVSLAQRVFSLPTLVSFSLAVAFIIFLATRFDFSWGQTWSNIRAVDPWLYGLALCLHYVGFGLRGLRWKVLAKKALPAGLTHMDLPPAPRLAQLVMIGSFVNSVAWLRMGDAYRAYLLSRRMRGSFSWALGTILAEHVVDLMVVFTLILVGAVMVSVGHGSFNSSYVIAAALLMLTGLALLLLMRQKSARLARFLPARLERAYHMFRAGALGALGQVPLVLAISASVWLLEVGRLFLVARSMDLELAVALAIIVTMSHAVLSVVPTPGGLGAVEVGLTGLLVVAGMERSAAGSMVLLERSITYLSVIVIGGLLLVLWRYTYARRGSRALAADQTDTGVESRG